MPTYRYRALDKDRKIYQGVSICPSKRELFHRLKNRNHFLLSARIHYPQMSFLPSLFSISLNQALIIFCVHMEQMDRVGIPLLEALNDMSHFNAPLKLRIIISEIYDEVKGGSMLSQALRHYPYIFDPLFVQIIAISEKTGHLHKGFEKLVAYLKWLEEIKSKIFHAIRYPAILGLILIITFAVLLTTVVPPLMSFLLSLNITPPPLTMALISTSDFLKKHVLSLFLGFSIIPASSLILKRFSSQAAYRLDYCLFRIPLIGPLRKKILLARYFQSFSILLNAEIDVLESFQLAETTITNSYLKKKLQKIREQVKSGLPLSQAIEESKVFPHYISHMFKIAERSNHLPQTLEIMRYFFDNEINNRIKTLIDLIEPGLILTFGCFMFWLIMAMFYPVYDHLTLAHS